MTLLELMVVLVISAIVIAGITRTMIDLDQTSRVRNLNAAMQGEGRDALQVLERDVRQASLGATLGVIWTQDSMGNVVQRPAVQIFDNVSAAGAGLDVKAGTDALLVVGSVSSGARAAVQGVQYDSTRTLSVTQTTDPLATTGSSSFQQGDAILVGPYQQAAWARITSVIAAAGVTPGGLNLSPTQNVYPNGRVDSGAMVRRARARLYYVDSADELVQVDLLVPRAPASKAEMSGRNVIARGFENLQIDCETETGVAAAPCPGPAVGTPAAAEAAWALGAWAGGGARLGAASVSTLRTVVLMAVARSQSPVLDQSGDPPIAVGNQVALKPGGVSDPAQPYVRRSYRLPVAVRNVSLGAL